MMVDHTPFICWLVQRVSLPSMLEPKNQHISGCRYLKPTTVLESDIENQYDTWFCPKKSLIYPRRHGAMLSSQIWWGIRYPMLGQTYENLRASWYVQFVQLWYQQPRLLINELQLHLYYCLLLSSSLLSKLLFITITVILTLNTTSI